MFYLKTALIVFISLCFNPTYGQEKVYFRKVSMLKWTDGEQVDKLHKFDYLFRDDVEQLRKFKKFNRIRKAQKISNYFGFALVPATPLAFYYGVLDNGDDHHPAVVIAFAGAILTGPAYLLLSNLIMFPIKVIRKRKLLRTLESRSFGYAKRPVLDQDVKLSISTTSNGLGLVLQF